MIKQQVAQAGFQSALDAILSLSRFFIDVPEFS